MLGNSRINSTDNIMIATGGIRVNDVFFVKRNCAATANIEITNSPKMPIVIGASNPAKERTRDRGMYRKTHPTCQQIRLWHPLANEEVAPRGPCCERDATADGVCNDAGQNGAGPANCTTQHRCAHARVSPDEDTATFVRSESPCMVR